MEDTESPKKIKLTNEETLVIRKFMRKTIAYYLTYFKNIKLTEEQTKYLDSLNIDKGCVAELGVTKKSLENLLKSLKSLAIGGIGNVLFDYFYYWDDQQTGKKIHNFCDFTLSIFTSEMLGKMTINFNDSYCVENIIERHGLMNFFSYYLNEFLIYQKKFSIKRVDNVDYIKEPGMLSKLE